MSAKPGVIKNIHIDAIVNEHIIDQLIWGKSGDIIEDVLKYKAGILIMEFTDADEMHRIVTNFHELVTVEVME